MSQSVVVRHRTCSFLLLLALALPPLAGSTAILEFALPDDGSDVVGEEAWIPARYEDTLLALAREHGLGMHELRSANPDVDPWLPGEGTRIELPTRFVLPPGPREGIVVNLAEYRLYYFPPGEDRVLTVPVGIGRAAFQTPVLQARVIDRIEQPSWTPPASVRASYAERGVELARVVPPGPDNPLGDYALMLDVPGYLIHGTNQPHGVGGRVSHGCLRLYPEDIGRLVWKIPVGTPVRIVHAPFKAGWHGTQLLLEAHRPLEEFAEEGLTAMIRAIVEATGDGDEVNWSRAERVGLGQRGTPVTIGERPAARVSQQSEPADGPPADPS